MLKPVLTVSLLVLTTGAATAQETMRCSHQLPPQHAVSGVIDRWAEEVETLSNGEIDVQVFGANSLVAPQENITAVARGTIECAFSVNFQWGRTLPIMNVTLAPFAFQDLDMWREWPSSAAAAFLEEKLLEKGLRNVAWLFQTNQSVFTSNGAHLVAPEDFEGVKIRGLTPTFDAALTAMGAATSAMPGSEVYQALATGVIDAAITDVAAAYARKYYEVQDHMTQSPVISVYFHGYVNPAFYDGLSDGAKAALDEAGLEAALWAVDAAEQAVAEAPDLLRAEGVALHVATPEENAALEAVMRPAFDAAFEKEAGEDTRRLLELLDQM
ncbi:TRAP transporter substrate-binding protein DctP [Salinarimonas sp.]|uniref:TRAP transporter substrate-binding protein DctP n=1 Tax=Salinarimonas sp. TaxID=2766526 RepID=UPI0032D8C039